MATMTISADSVQPASHATPETLHLFSACQFHYCLQGGRVRVRINPGIQDVGKKGRAQLSELRETLPSEMEQTPGSLLLWQMACCKGVNGDRSLCSYVKVASSSLSALVSLCASTSSCLTDAMKLLFFLKKKPQTLHLYNFPFFPSPLKITTFF